MRKAITLLAVGGATTLGMAAATIPFAHAAPPTRTAVEYVAPAASSSAGNSSCSDAGFTSIQTAADAAPTGGTVVVCAGTYHESVTVTKQLTLQGRQGAVIDAKGGPYGIGLAASYVTVTGLTVEHATANQKTQAPGDGIITAGFVNNAPVTGNSEIISRNVVKNNDGAGIDMETTSYSEVTDNVSEHNGIGINLTNDFGKPASHNRITGNVASNNPGGCGIVLADHSGAGVFSNVVSGNTANNNGLGTPSAPNASSGSGIILAAGGKGGVYRNLIESNRLSGNGHGGVALHAHAPGANFAANRLVDNFIGTNNKRTDYRDKHTTGIYLGSVSKLVITVAHNQFSRDHNGVFSAGPVKIKGKSSNTFSHVAHHFVHIAKYAG